MVTSRHSKLILYLLSIHNCPFLSLCFCLDQSVVRLLFPYKLPNSACPETQQEHMQSKVEHAPAY